MFNLFNEHKFKYLSMISKDHLYLFKIFRQGSYFKYILIYENLKEVI